MLWRVLTTGDDDHLGLWPLAARAPIGTIHRRPAIGITASAKTQLGPLTGTVHLAIVFVDRRGDVVDILLPVGMLGGVVPHIAAGLAEMVAGPG